MSGACMYLFYNAYKYYNAIQTGYIGAVQAGIVGVIQTEFYGYGTVLYGYDISAEFMDVYIYSKILYGTAYVERLSAKGWI